MSRQKYTVAEGRSYSHIVGLGILPLMWISCVALEDLLNLSELQFPDLYNGAETSNCSPTPRQMKGDDGSTGFRTVPSTTEELSIHIIVLCIICVLKRSRQPSSVRPGQASSRPWQRAQAQPERPGMAAGVGGWGPCVELGFCS